jgi:NAD-dependent dihydropyrimidine dehydrogenase PreA subunit
MILLNQHTCDYCGACVGVCPENCIALYEMDLQIDHNLCTRCQKCIWICPVEALYHEKQK